MAWSILFSYLFHVLIVIAYSYGTWNTGNYYLSQNIAHKEILIISYNLRVCLLLATIAAKLLKFTVISSFLSVLLLYVTSCIVPTIDMATVWLNRDHEILSLLGVMS